MPILNRLGALCAALLLSFHAHAESSAAERQSLCNTVVQHINQQTLHTLYWTGRETVADEATLRATFGEHYYPHTGSYWRLDLDGDGIEDHLLHEVSGSMHNGSMASLSGKPGAVPVSQSNEGAPDMHLLFVNGRYYVVDGYEDWKDKLWQFNSDGDFEAVCQFKPRQPPQSKLTSGHSEEVCTAVAAGKIEHVHLEYEHAIQKVPDTDAYWSVLVSAYPEMGYFDIDNDGKPDAVLRMMRAHGAGRGCDQALLAVADMRRNRVPDTPLNRLLVEHIGRHRCGPAVDAFTFGGVTYIDALARKGHRWIYKISKGKANTICTFHGTVFHDVAPL